MTDRFRVAIFTAVGFAAGISAAVTSVPVNGQTTRTAAYVAPRTADGKPDLSGIWQTLTTASWNIQDHTAQPGVPAGQGIVEGNDIPYQPSALEKKKANVAARATEDSVEKCFLPGVPRIMYMPFPFEIVQTPQYIAIATEYTHADRIIYTNGTPHAEPLELWMGDSRGHWEGETLVVDVSQFNDRTWFDRAGNFHSAALHVVERYRRTGPDLLSYEATIEDPQVFTRPWKIRFPLYRRQEPHVQLLEYNCMEFKESFPTFDELQAIGGVK